MVTLEQLIELKKNGKRFKINYENINSDNEYFFNDEILYCDTNSDGRISTIRFNDLLNATIEELPWIPKINEQYYFISSEGAICKTTFINQKRDENRIKLGNYFKTESEAMASRLHVKNAFKWIKENL